MEVLWIVLGVIGCILSTPVVFLLFIKWCSVVDDFIDNCLR